MVGDKRNVQQVARACEGAISVFSGFKVCFEEEQTTFATSFNHIAQLIQESSYPQYWDLFFFVFLFFLYSRNYNALNIKKKNT